MFKKQLLLLGLPLLSPFVAAEPLTEVDWRIEKELYRCALISELNYLNVHLDISAEPEKSMSLYVVSDGFERFSKNTSLAVNYPYWKRFSDKKFYALNVSDVDSRIIASNDSVERVLEDLKAGYWIGLVDGSFSAEFPSLSMNVMAEQFNECRSNMPLLNFDTARDNALQFEQGRADGTTGESDKSLLDGIASVITKDKTVVKVLVDGHTDSSGDEIDNLQLSRERASYVAMQLVNRGVSVDIVETRAHGQRYPLKSNSTSSGRTENRRVQIRLTRKVQ